MSAHAEPQCQALNVSDGQRCREKATASNDLFCKFHANQCYGLYKGYKERNARLDNLQANPPPYLAESRTSLAAQNFTDVDDETTLHELHNHLFKRYALLIRVIEARKLHHSRFYSLKLDYGHQAYLDKLQGQKFTALRALERLERRTAEVLYQKQKWFNWVRQCQDDEEAQRESEKVKVQREAAMFKRHWKEMQARLAALRNKEERKRQDAYLEEAYKARMAEEDELTWDPIEDVLEDERSNYIELIKHFLWLQPSETSVDEVQQAIAGASISEQPLLNESEPSSSPTPGNFSTESQSSSKKKKKKAKATSAPPESSKAPQRKQAPQAVSTKHTPDKANVESIVEVRSRLSTGVKYTGEILGPLVAGSVETPMELIEKTAPLSDDEISQLMKDISEVKLLLFCRLLLSQATLLPVALRANNIEEFLIDRDVSDTDLRDLCLRLEQPALQEIRDACADLTRGDEESTVGDEDEEAGEMRLAKENATLLKDGRFWDRRLNRNRAIPNKWNSKREKERRDRRNEKIFQGEQNTFVDFGDVDDKGQFTRKKIRVKICGRYIWNYASDSAMARSGWLQFSVMANCSLYKAVELCRSWEEFFELNVLTLYGYFPAAAWRAWSGDRLKQQLLQLGFIPYALESSAEEGSIRRQTGSRGHAPRQHMMREVRNYVCAHMKRNDPVTRRFIQYICMKTSRLLILARDGKDGRILIEPPKEQLWLKREKAGMGRASKNEWKTHLQVGEDFFEQMDQKRSWHFGFKDYYDVYIWDLEPGQSFAYLYSVVQETLSKARRFTSGRDLYSHVAPILKTITRDPITKRARDIRPDANERSLYDEISGPDARFYYGDLFGRGPSGTEFKEDHKGLKHMLYNEADALEDAVLFPDELTSDGPAGIFEEVNTKISKWEREGPILSRFVHDLDTDERLSDILDASDAAHSEDEPDSDENFSSEMSEGSDEDWEYYLKGETEENHDSNSSREPLYGWQVGVAKIYSIELFRLDFSKGVEQIENNAIRELIQRWEQTSKEKSLSEKTKDDMHAEFIEWMERDRSGAFKEMFHAVDMEPGAKEKYDGAMRLVKSFEHYEMRNLKRAEYCLLMLGFLNVHPQKEKRATKDMIRSYAMVCPFFPNLEEHSIHNFLASEHGLPFKDSLLLDQVEKAKALPDRRTYVSNRYMPEEFWEDWLKILHGREHPEDAYPLEWAKVVRPVLAKLYKEGLIAPHHRPIEAVEGTAIAAREPNRDKLDLYFDYGVKPEGEIPKGMTDPKNWPDLLSHAKKFTASNPNARFSLLRIWTGEHFYPLMLGHWNREPTSFKDGIGRCWEWKFVPKDMPGSEWSIHFNMEQALGKFKRQLHFGKQVLPRRDIIFVMGSDEEELMKLTIGATYAVQARPWIREIDLWKSFINVDEDFLKGLHRWWLD